MAWEGKSGASLLREHVSKNKVRQKSDRGQLTLFLGDGNWQEGTEGHDRQHGKKHADAEEELKAF